MKNHPIIYLIIISSLGFLLHSCEKDKENSQELLAYIKGPDADPHHKRLNFIRTPSAIIGENQTKFTAHLTRAITSDVTVSLAPDLDAVSSYNALNKTAYLPLPSANYKIQESSDLVIKAGATFSTDSIHLVLQQQELLSDPKGYLLPISIRTVSSGDRGVRASTNYKTVYIVINSIFNNINQALETTPPGNVINRSDWSVLSYSTAFDDNYQGEKTLDNDNETAWFSDANNFEITIDMKKEHKLRGFILTPNYTFGAYYNPSQITVLISTDNINWIEQGTYLSKAIDWSSSPQNPDNRNINFYAPVQMRYFRLILDRGLSSGYNGLAEIRGVD
ncbi:MAG: DUF1735 domain-containing protein [Sphingobacterium sp.]|jgi:hypothetical protein|nr:DUF1735 domain-containing protein [Sphingobacterium sp.]